MNSSISIFHRFLRSHSFYPLVLSTLLAAAFYTFRVFYSSTTNYSNLVWNLFLAWLPYIISVITSYVYQTTPKNWGLIFILIFFWLIFFPNAPYLVTDFYHLNPRPPVPIWFDISLIAIFAFTGCFLSIASLRSIHLIMEGFFGKFIGWIFAFFALGLGSLGVYLGRFGRYNTWDIFLETKSVIKEIAYNILNPADNLGFVGFTLMFTAILFVFYLMFVTSSTPRDSSITKETQNHNNL